MVVVLDFLSETAGDGDLEVVEDPEDDEEDDEEESLLDDDFRCLPDLFLVGDLPRGDRGISTLWSRLEGRLILGLLGASVLDRRGAVECVLLDNDEALVELNSILLLEMWCARLSNW